MAKKILTADMENFIYKNCTLMTPKQIADYLEIKRTTIWGFYHRKGLKFKHGIRYPNPDLTERENQIAELVSAGLSNSDICEKLFISYATVITHIKNIYQKYDIYMNRSDDKGACRVKLVLEYLKRNHKLID